MLKSRCTRCMGVLGIPSRMKIYKYLKNINKSRVSEIVDLVNLTQPTVSYHLSEMKKAGLLISEKKGKEVFYKINRNCVLKGVNF